MEHQVMTLREGPAQVVRLAVEATEGMLTIDGIRQLAQAIADGGRDPAVKLIRLQSVGRVFCSGRKPAGPPAAAQSAAEFRRNVADPILSVYRAMHESEVPVLAEVQGDAHGFGCAVVAAADLAVVASQAMFSLPEMKNNLPPTLVLSVFRNRVPPKATAHLTYLGGRFTAAQALTWGIAGEVLPGEALAARCDEVARWLVSRDRLALSTMKSYWRAAVTPGLAPAAELAGSLLAGAMTSMR